MRILWLKTELLHPIDKGGKIRTYHLLRQLKRDHHITYLTLDEGGFRPDAQERAGEYCHRLVRVPHRTRPKFSAGFYAELATNLASGLPYFVAKYESPRMRREVEMCTERGKLDILVCDFLMPSINVPRSVSCPTLLFQHNVEAMIWKRHHQVQSNPIKKSYLYDQWRKARRFERDSCRRFDYVVGVSRDDCAIMRNDYGVENVADIPTGVDTDYFRPCGDERSEPHNLVFTGSMDWLPNQDAILYFAERIMPLVKRMVPDVTLTVVGRNPYPGLIELARRDPSIALTGRVDDVRPYMERAGAYIVPLRIGGGTRLKIYEAMAMEKAIISTSIGAEGLPVRDGEQLLLADDPEAFAAAVARTITDEAFARDLGARAAKAVRDSCGWPRVAERFAEICERVASRTPLQVTEANLQKDLQIVA